MNPHCYREFLDARIKGSDFGKRADGERCAGSESPDNSGGGAVVVLVGAGIVTVHVIALQPPGKILEGKFIVGAAADVDRERVIDEAVGVYVADASHGMHEGAPFSVGDRKARTADDVILLDPGAIKAAAIGDQAEAGETGEGNGFVRAGPAAITLLVDDVGELSVGDSGVDVAIGKKSVELCRHRDREQHEYNKRQHSGGSLRHEIFLPGGCAGKKCN